MASKNGSKSENPNQEIPIRFPDYQSGFQKQVDSYSYRDADESEDPMSNKEQNVTFNLQGSNHQTKQEQNHNGGANKKSLMATQKSKTIENEEENSTGEYHKSNPQNLSRTSDGPHSPLFFVFQMSELCTSRTIVNTKKKRFQQKQRKLSSSKEHIYCDGQ